MALSEAEELELLELEEAEAQSARAPAEAQSRPGAAFLRGAQDLATLGYTPQIAGGVQTGTEGLIRLLGKAGVGPYKDIDQEQLKPVGDTYLEARDQSVREADALRKSDPGMMIAGNLVGGGLTAGAIPFKAAKAANALSKIRSAALQGGTAGLVSNPGDKEGVIAPLQAGERAMNAGMGAAVGGAVGAGVEGLKAVGRGVRGVSDAVSRRAAAMTKPQAQAYVQDPKEVSQIAAMLEDQSQAPALQDKAVQAIENSRRALKATGIGRANQLSEALKGKQVEINPRDYLNVSDKADEMIGSMIDQRYARSMVPAPRVESGLPSGARMIDDVAEQAMVAGDRVVPDKMSVDANQMNALKRLLQGEGNYLKGSITDPTQRAKAEAIGNVASKARAAVESVAPEAAALNQSMQENQLLQQALRQGQKTNPLAFVSSEAPDRVATLARAEGQGAKGLLNFGNQLGAAKSMTMKDVDDALSRYATRKGGRAGLRANEALSKILSAPLPEDRGRVALIEALIQNKK